MLLAILTDLLKIDEVLMIIKNNAAVSEIKSNSLNIKQKEKWITIGDSDDPAHIHINTEMIRTAEFIENKKPVCTSFSIQFFDQNHEPVLSAFFTKMYDDDHLNLERKKIYENLCQKYGSKIKF